MGEQIQAFFDFAENNPDRAVPFFVNIWQTQASLTTRALALQGLGVAAKHYHVKEALADWDVLRDIAKEVKGKGEVSNDLTRWAAASALEAIGYSQQSLQHLEGGGFTEPLDRIRREIRDRKLVEINRIQRLNTRGETTAEYDRNREFWLYGPVEELFAGNDSSWNYQELVGDVVHDLHGRGVYLGLRSSNRIVHEAALREAEQIFKESAEIEEFIYGLLEEFLHNSNHEVSLRITAAKIIHTATDLSKKLKTLSKLLSQEKDTKLLEVVLHHAQSLFMESVDNQKFIYGYLEQFLIDRTQEVTLRIMAIEIITKASGLKKVETLSKLLLEDIPLQNVALRQIRLIFKESSQIEELLFETLDQFLNYNYEVSLKIDAAELVYTARNLNKKLTTLSKLLLEDTELRNLAVRLLTPYKQELARVNADAHTVLDALVFNYTLKTWQKPELQESKISQLETYLSSASQYQREISPITYRPTNPNNKYNPEAEVKYRKSVVWAEYLQWMQESATEDNEKLDNPLRREIKKLVYKDLTISQLETNLSSAIQYQREISGIFTSAIDAAELLGEKYGKSGSLVTGYLQSKHEDAIQATDKKSTHPLREQIKELVHIQNSIKKYQSFLKRIPYRIKSIDSNLYRKIKNFSGFASLEHPKKIDTYNDCLQTFDELDSLRHQVFYESLDKRSEVWSQQSEQNSGLDELLNNGCLVIIALIFMLLILKDILIILFIVIGLIVLGYRFLISHLNNKEKLIEALLDDLLELPRWWQK
ncbi:hypothetical protein QUB56_22790 [Microcoleus sp. AR_TQ3_B6]|uniref:hypothetical protein n=1 Tax=Microcoleus sp. AR_TQ3_B6 TaxID=3055284 RepID=UPI002FD2FE5C